MRPQLGAEQWATGVMVATAATEVMEAEAVASAELAGLVADGAESR